MTMHPIEKKPFGSFSGGFKEYKYTETGGVLKHYTPVIPVATVAALYAR